MSDPCAPLTLTRALEDFPIGNLPLREHRQRLPELEGLAVHPHAWLDPEELRAWLAGGCGTLCDGVDREPIVWRGGVPDAADAMVAARSFIIRYPWDLLRANEQYVAGFAESDLRGEVHPLAVIDGNVCLGKGSMLLPGVYIEGNVVIGENCKIGPNCYLRGSTSIGDNCHIGQSVEIKNCLILSRTNVGHLSYIGDSVLGEKVNLGAGTTVSNLRHDGKNHRSMVRGELMDTGRRKFGSIIGDGVHTGINTSVYPGRKFWPGTSTLPGDIVRHDVLP